MAEYFSPDMEWCPPGLIDVLQKDVIYIWQGNFFYVGHFSAIPRINTV